MVQSYIQRWEIECKHREEKSLLGVAQGQVRSPQAVRRLPQFQVAGGRYSLLLLASLLSSGFRRTADYLPLPKWRRQTARPSLLDLPQSSLSPSGLRSMAWALPIVNFDNLRTCYHPHGREVPRNSPCGR